MFLVISERSSVILTALQVKVTALTVLINGEPFSRLLTDNSFNLTELHVKMIFDRNNNAKKLLYLF